MGESVACWATEGGREMGSPPDRTPGGTAGGSLVALTSREKSGLGGTAGLAGRVLLRGVSEPAGIGEDVSLGWQSPTRGVDVAGVSACSGSGSPDTFLSTGETSITSGVTSVGGMGESWQCWELGNYFHFLVLLLCVIVTFYSYTK